MKKRLLSAFLALCMMLTMAPTFAFATGDDPAGSNYVQNGEPVTTEDGVTVSKTAERTGENAYNITLSVTIPPSVTTPGQGADVVLVIDSSGSMDDGKMWAARISAKQFADALLKEEGVRVAIVDYDKYADAACRLTSNILTVYNAIDGIWAGGGTNIQAGLHVARGLLEDSEASNKVIVLLSDGDPTFSYPVKGTADWRGCSIGGLSGGHYWTGYATNINFPTTITENDFDYSETVGNGKNYSYGVAAELEVTCEHNQTKTVWYNGDLRPYKNNGAPAIAEAGFAKADNCEIYSLYLGNPSQNAIDTMSGIATDKDHYMKADNDSLDDLMDEIADDVINTTAGSVIDPMGENIILGDVNGLAGVVPADDNSSLIWTPQESQGTKNEDGSVTYTVTYPITVDTTAEGFEGGWLPANGKTTFTYKVNGADKTAEFNVPNVWGDAKKYTVTYVGNGATGGSTKDENLYANGETATILPNGFTKDGYVFVGWNTEADGTGTPYPAGSDVTITGDLTLYAQWSGDAAEYVVQHYLQNSDETYPNDPEQEQLKSGTVGETVTAEPETFPGYTYDPDVEGTIASGTIPADGSLVLKLYYRLNTQFNVTYLVDGVEVMSSQHAAGENVVVEQPWPGATEWKILSGLTEDNIADLNGAQYFKMPQNDVIFTATTGGTVTPDDCTYAVISHYIGRDGEQVGVVHDTALLPGTVGTPVDNLYSTTNTTFIQQTYVFDRAELNSVVISGGETLADGENIIDVYYDIDDISWEDPDKPGPDGIPDKDQIVFTYLSADEEMGTVSLDSVVVTKESNGLAFAPRANALPESGYAFDYWTDSNGIKGTDVSMSDMPENYFEDTTFTAHFKEADIPEEAGYATVYFTAVNGTFEIGENNIGAYTATVKADADGVYRLSADTVYTAVPLSDRYEETGSWTLTRDPNREDCDEPVPGTVVQDGDSFEVTFLPKETGTTVAVSYEWTGEAPYDMDPPSTDFVTINSDAGTEYTVKNPPIRVEDEEYYWYFMGWTNQEGEPYEATIKVTGNMTLYGSWDRTEKPEDPDEPIPTPGDERFMVIKESDQTAVNAGDTIQWTITIASMSSETLTLTVTDDLADTLTYADGTAVEGPVTVSPWQMVTLYATYQTKPSDANTEIVNTVVVASTDTPDDPVEEVAPPVEVGSYSLTISPADITIYTGGTGYGGVTDGNGNIIPGTESSGLPQPGFHIDLSDELVALLQGDDSGMSDQGAADLSNILTFTYDFGGQTREWTMNYMGIYSSDESTGVPTRYVYSLNPAQVGDEEIPVRVQFTDAEGNIQDDDSITMSESDVNTSYTMTIDPGTLEQGQIKAVLQIDGQTSVTCDVHIGTGTLLVKSVADDNAETNAIVSDAYTIGEDTITAVADDSVHYYVNESEVEVSADRVELLVDEVSNSNEFNSAMGSDAISKVQAENADVYNLRYDTVYMDLVDTRNGNTIATMGENDKLTIYWPAPSNAASDSEYHIVHYYSLDRTDIIGADELDNTDAEVLPGELVTINGNDYIKFEVNSFSPFVLVWEARSNGGSSGGGSSRPDDLNTEDHYAYIIGYPKDYRTGEPTDDESLWPVEPQGDITRAEVATLFFRMLTDDARDRNWSQTNNFTDVPATEWYNNAISTLANMGILSGDPDGSFRPDDSITRAEFTKIAVSFFEVTGDYVDGTYSDIPANAWYADFIDAAVDLGLIEGYPDGTIRPQASITRAEACTIVNRTLGRVPDKDHLLPTSEMRVWPDNSDTNVWYYAQIQEATNSHDYEWIGEEGDQIENWTDKLADRNWAALEDEWSDANDAPGGEVMD